MSDELKALLAAATERPWGECLLLKAADRKLLSIAVNHFERLVALAERIRESTEGIQTPPEHVWHEVASDILASIEESCSKVTLIATTCDGIKTDQEAAGNAYVIATVKDGPR